MLRSVLPFICLSLFLSVSLSVCLSCFLILSHSLVAPIAASNTFVGGQHSRLCPHPDTSSREAYSLAAGYVVTDLFSGAERAVGPLRVCLSVCPHNNCWTCGLN